MIATNASSGVSAVEDAVRQCTICLRPDEEVGIETLVVDSVRDLGLLTACRFLEWVEANPDGVIALPTGRSPLPFIEAVTAILADRVSSAMQARLDEWGVRPGKPDLGRLTLVQMDEYFPMASSRTSSFAWFVNQQYIQRFGLDRQRVLMIECERMALPGGISPDRLWPDGGIDLTLRLRNPRNRDEEIEQAAIRAVDDWCDRYEREIRDRGGIGFFLGGIGPDGHVAFNVAGSSHFSPTRLCETNYATRAAAATGLGGIEVASRYPVITIGLGTITANPRATAIIIAAGAGKARVVADAVHGTASVARPATALHALAGARMFLTGSAASAIPGVSAEASSDRKWIDASIASGRPLDELIDSDRNAMEAARTGGLADRLAARVVGGCSLFAARVLHTEPHHDDIMLGYLPAIARALAEGRGDHWFTTLTSGFTAVTNRFALDHAQAVSRYLDSEGGRIYASHDTDVESSARLREAEVLLCLEAIAGGDESSRGLAECRRGVRDVMRVLGTSGDIAGTRGGVEAMIRYLQSAEAGQADPAHIQAFKGCIREWESETMWGLMGVPTSRVHHERLAFYCNKQNFDEVAGQRDVPHMVRRLREIRPEVVTVALDPEGAGPDTHFKVLQIVSEAVSRYEAECDHALQVIGYRNVWHRFHLTEATACVPVTLGEMASMDHAFKATYRSQRDASFPSPEFEGPFSELAWRVQHDQWQELVRCLGDRTVHASSHRVPRAAHGLVLLVQLTPGELRERCRRITAAVSPA